MNPWKVLRGETEAWEAKWMVEIYYKTLIFYKNRSFSDPPCLRLAPYPWHTNWNTRSARKKHHLGPYVLGLRETSTKITGPSIYFLWDVFYFLLYIVLFLSNSPSHCNSGKCDGQYLQQWFCSVTSPCIFEWNRVTVKIWSQYLQYLQSYLEIFIRHFAAARPLLETDNISPVCRYIM